MNRDKELSSGEGEFRALPKYGSVQSSSEMPKRPVGGSDIAEVVQCRGKGIVFGVIGLDSNLDAHYSQ